MHFLTPILCLALATSLFATPAASQTVTFDDEFDAPTLDTTQWVALNRGGDTGNAEQQCYLPSNASLSGGFLTMLSQDDANGCASIGTSYRFSSAMVQWRSFNFLYGTIETRARFAGGTGTWPAFWLLGSDCQQTNITSADSSGTCSWPNPGSDEIDVVEILYSHQNIVNEQIHSTAGNPGCNAQVSDVSQDYHTYGLTWAPDQLTFRIDGVVTCVLTQAVPSHPMFLMINTAIGGQAGQVNPGTLPQTTSVDYVRVTTN